MRNTSIPLVQRDVTHKLKLLDWGFDSYGLGTTVGFWDGDMIVRYGVFLGMWGMSKDFGIVGYGLWR